MAERPVISWCRQTCNAQKNWVEHMHSNLFLSLVAFPNSKCSYILIYIKLKLLPRFPTEKCRCQLGLEKNKEVEWNRKKEEQEEIGLMVG